MKVRYVLVLLICFSSFGGLAKEVKPFVIPNTDTFDLLDPFKDRSYPIFVKYPVNYDPLRAYPVIYMTDGGYLFPTLAGALGIPMLAGKINNSFLVAVSWQNDLSTRESRILDYTHSVDETWRPQTGGAQDYLSFLQNSVIPTIEKKYRIDVTSKTYVGNSLGGLFGGYVLMEAPDTFNNYVLSSPSFWFKKDSLLKRANKFDSKKAEANVYISVGRLETPEAGETVHNMVEVAKRFHDILAAKNLPNLNLQFHIVDSANHEVAFTTSIIQGLYWLSKNGT